MSLNTAKPTAKAEIKQILEDMLTKENNSTDEFAERLTNVFEKWLKQATVKYISGLVAGSNPVTGTFTGNLE